VEEQVTSSLAKRAIGAVVVLWGAVTFTFVALHMVKGDAAQAIAGGTTVLSPAVRQQIIDDYHLDDPLLVQYWHYLERLLHGDLGQSYVLRMPVSTAIGQQLGATLQLRAAASVLAFVGALVVALLTANRSPAVKAPFSAVEVSAVAIPSFWLGILLLTVFSFRLHWFPAVGEDGPRGLVLPAIALALAPGALLTQVLRQGLERTLEEPFVLTARTRGITESLVLVRHVLRHALLPVITLAGWLVGTMIGGAVIVEQVFSRQGLGRLTVAAINGRDYPLVIGVVVVAAVFYVVVNSAIDVLYGVLDPRLRSPARTLRPAAGGAR
jgi:peptide/nickel transport system permease protein